MNNQAFDDQQIRSVVQDELTRNQHEAQKIQSKLELATIAGTVGGGALGLAAIEPVRAIQNERAFTKAFESSDMRMRQATILKNLRDVYLGNARFEDFGKNEKVLRNLSENPDFKKIYTNENNYRAYLKKLDRGNLVPFKPETFPAKLRRYGQAATSVPLFPGGANGAIKNVVTHPLVAAGAITGGSLVNQAYQYNETKELPFAHWF